MNTFKYFIVRVPQGDQYPFIKMDENSLAMFERRASNKIATPLKFMNAWREDNIEEGISEEVGEVLFSGSQILVSGDIKNNLVEYSERKDEALTVGFLPAVYIDDKDVWHEDYWFVDVHTFIDCWSRDASKYRTVPTEDEPLYHVQSYCIDYEKLQEFKGKDLIFKIGNNVRPPLVVKEEIVKYFDLSGVELVELKGE